MNAPARVPPTPIDLRERHGVETPEHIEVNLELAGVGTRAAAAVIDFGLILLFFLLLTLAFGLFGMGNSAGETWVIAGFILLGSFAVFLYHILFEGLWGGRTPGKRALGIRVVMDTGRALTFNAAAVRNLIRLIDVYFPLVPVLPGLLSVFFSKSNKRLGDFAAGTIVVRDRPVEWILSAIAPPSSEPEDLVETGPPELADDEFKLLDRFLARMSDLAPNVQVRMSVELARRFEQRIPRRSGDLQEYLVTVFAEEQRRRRGRFATRARGAGSGAGTVAAPGRITVTAERFIARKRDGWEAFRQLAARLERTGVGTLPPAEIPAFAARYREVAADLARARTYGVDARVIEYLERLVGAGHNALYRSRGRHRPSLDRFVIGDFPAAVMESWRYVLAAFLLFAVPAAAGYVMLRERPALAEEVMPPVMVGRAEQAAERQARGIGYAQSEDEELPVIASFIISNNIRVCLLVFTGGLIFGLLTAWALVTNGLSIGMGFGLFANYDAASYLGTFVAGHGVLELTAIFISGGAGFRLARALIAPGDRTRKDALVVDGRIAIRMIGSVVCLLLLAGAIEGLLSASDAAPGWKFAVSGASVVLLVLYFWNGWRYRNALSAKTSVVPRLPAT